jgi:hypothetical protein
MRCGSRRYHETGTAAENAATAADCAARLGVSESAVRKILNCSEWHHSNLRYGGAAKAYYYAWTREQVAEALWESREGYGSLVTNLKPAEFVAAWLRARRAWKKRHRGA